MSETQSDAVQVGEDERVEALAEWFYVRFNGGRWSEARDEGREAARLDARAVLAALPSLGYTHPRTPDSDGPDPDLISKWQAASDAARKAEHHFPADCLAEAVTVYTHLTTTGGTGDGFAWPNPDRVCDCGHRNDQHPNGASFPCTVCDCRMYAPVLHTGPTP